MLTLTQLLTMILEVWEELSTTALQSMNAHETGQAPFLTPPPEEREIQVEQILGKERSLIFF